MKAVHTLPQNYKEILSVDMKIDKKLFWLVNGLAAVISIILIVAMHLYVPITTLFDMSSGMEAYSARFIVLLVLMIAYIVLHELTHGVAMKICGTQKVRYGFTGMYAFAASDDYYDKQAYIFTALAPIVLWGIVLAVVNFLVPSEWFWVIYFVQVINLSGAAGDLYVTVKFSRLPDDILVRDYGVCMTVYSQK